MGMLPITIRKRTITDADIVQIQATLRGVGPYPYGPEAVNKHWSQGRKHISKVLCRQWNWFQPNGRLKDMACRELLLTLNRKGLITLPPLLTSANNEKRNRTIPAVNIDRSPLQEKLINLGFVDLKPVRNTKLEPLYNSLIASR
jgi:hypothetical protein